jgi:acetyl-CoA carboxylase alpha subunit
MKIKLQARDLWEAIEPGGVPLKGDRMALNAITSTVPPEMVSSLAAKDTALEAWMAVKQMRIRSEQVQKTEAQRLLREFKNMRTHR